MPGCGRCQYKTDTELKRIAGLLCLAAILRCLLIFLHGRSRTYRVASLRAGPVGRISYNLYFDCKLVRYVTCGFNKRIYFRCKTAWSFLNVPHLANFCVGQLNKSKHFKFSSSKTIIEPHSVPSETFSVVNGRLSLISFENIRQLLPLLFHTHNNLDIMSFFRNTVLGNNSAFIYIAHCRNFEVKIPYILQTNNGHKQTQDVMWYDQEQMSTVSLQATHCVNTSDLHIILKHVYIISHNSTIHNDEHSLNNVLSSVPNCGLRMFQASFIFVELYQRGDFVFVP